MSLEALLDRFGQAPLLAAGGLLIGAAAGLFMVGSGRTAGITTILASPLQALLKGRSFAPEMSRAMFLIGLLAAPWLWQLFAALPAARPVAGTAGLICAGLLVGSHRGHAGGWPQLQGRTGPAQGRSGKSALGAGTGSQVP